MRAGENRFKREIDPFAYSEFGDKLAMADVEGRRRKRDEHDHIPHLWDPEPWSDDKRRQGQKSNNRRWGR